MANQDQLPLGAEYVGEQVLVRTYSAGVHFGILARIENSVDGHFPLKLEKAQRIYSWKGACSLNQFAQDGADEESRISMKVPSIILNGIEVIPMSEKSMDCIDNQIGIWMYKDGKVTK